MGLSIQVVWSGPTGEGGEEILERAVDGLVEKLTDYSTVMPDIADIFEVHTMEQFATQGASGGTPWQPLAESTIRRREREVTRGRRGVKFGAALKGQRRVGQRFLQPLEGEVNTQILSGGPLEESFTRGAQGHVEEITPDGLTWGSGLVAERTGKCIPVIQHYGSVHIPARPILVTTPELADQVVGTVREYAQQSINEESWGGGGEQTLLGIASEDEGDVQGNVSGPEFIQGLTQ